MIKLGSDRRISFIPGIGINVITPQSAAAASAWWLSGGISAANCVAAYQAKGAASYAASLVNLAQPGTYDLTEGNGAVTWDATNGWRAFATGSKYFHTGFSNNSNNQFSALVRFANAPSGLYCLFGGDSSASGVCHILPRYSDKIYYRNHGLTGGYAPGLASGSVGFAANSGYRNGVLDGTEALLSRVVTHEIVIGAWNNAGAISRYFPGDIYAMSFYLTDISAYFALLHTAIMAL
jgi:hypothetical protein